jgi:hypothetical protein
MPQYTFKCPQGHEFSKFVASTIKEVGCQVCEEDAKRLLPKLAKHSEVLESMDSFTGKQYRTDMKDMINERKADHYWSVEVPKLVASGEHSLESMLSNQWVYYSDKGELEIRTKPPNSD